jgi:hypothetical protein
MSPYEDFITSGTGMTHGYQICNAALASMPGEQCPPGMMRKVELVIDQPE